MSNANPVITTLIQQFCKSMTKAGMIVSNEGESLDFDTEECINVYVTFINEGPGGPMANAFVGYLVGQGVNVENLNAHAPRQQILCLMDLLRPYADNYEHVAEMIADCDKYDEDYLQQVEIAESGATNVTKLH